MQRSLTIEEICRKLKPVFGKKIDNIYLKYAMADSREERDEIAHILNALYQKHLAELLDKKVLLEPPESLDGEYPIAPISYADKKTGIFNLREKDWVRHVCISGMSGSGKTTLGFHIVNNFIDKGKPFLIFDWKKSFRPLANIDSEIMNFTVGNDRVSNLFKTNINKPPKGVSPKEWINVLCDLLTESFFVSFGVHKILLETLDESFKEWGIYNGSENYPSWNHIKWRLEEKLTKTKGREAGWIESALRIASVLTFGSFGKVCNYKGDNRLNVEDLLNKKVIFELNSLGNIEKKFFCEFILTYIYKLKKARQHSSQGFDHAIVVDEAHNIFLKDKTHFVNESVTDMIYREMREYGTSLICLDQHISKLSDTVKGNSACHIAFQQQLPADIMDISNIMQLPDRRDYFSRLPVGSAIVKLSERYSNPFLIEVEEVDLRNQEVNDSYIKSRMENLFQVREIEQGKDNEFKQDLLQDPRVRESEYEEEVRVPNHALYNGELDEIKEKNLGKQEIILTPKQEILVEFVKEKSAENWDINDIKEFLESRKIQGEYDLKDISQAIDCYVGKDVVTSRKEQNNKVYKAKNTDFLAGKLTAEQERFLAFLQENPEHELSTVAVYKQVGLSARKGNNVKNELIEQGKIKIQEIKYNKGWKKIIRLV
tara:strand:+ start:1720 stop:3687 length:1968 start_codon:yes stop_codon:yes gene_type:complete